MKVNPSCLNPKFLLELNPCATLTDVSDFNRPPIFSSKFALVLLTLTLVSPNPSFCSCLVIFLSLSNLCLSWPFSYILSQFSNRNIIYPSFFALISSPNMGISFLYHLSILSLSKMMSDLVPPYESGAWFPHNDTP